MAQIFLQQFVSLRIQEGDTKALVSGVFEGCAAG